MSLRAAVKQNALLGLLLFSMIGGLASVAASGSRTATPDAHVSATPQKDTPTAAVTVDPADNQSFQAVTPLPDAASPKADTALKHACDQIAKTAATKAYRAASADENARHEHALFVLHGTGVVARVLSPSNYMARLDQEAAEHKQIMADLQKTYRHQLALAYCS